MLNFYFTVLDESCEGDNQESFETLYLTYRKKMYQIVYGVLHNSADAEDATHNAFLGIAQNYARVRTLEGDAVSAYVCRAAKNCALNILSKRSRRTVMEVPLPDEDAHCSTADALSILCWEESMETLVRCIRELPSPYRDVLHLYFGEEMNSTKIAALLGIKVDTAKKQIFRGKKLLAAKLKKEKVTPHEKP